MGDKIINRNYGSIAHLSTSKMTQQADKKIEEGQEAILTSKGRDWRDLIILTEKVDGSNVGVVRKGGELFSITRAGFPVNTSPYEQHHAFGRYMKNNLELFVWLPEGWRICGEWCIVAHGTMMDISDESPFIAFDIFDAENKRLLFIDFYSTCKKYDIPMVPILNFGQPVSIKNAIKLMGEGHYGKPEKPEGCVWRCEREGRVDFLAKWVRWDKEDGKYLDAPTYNKGGERYAR
jgi:hypothetical protein